MLKFNFLKIITIAKISKAIDELSSNNRNLIVFGGVTFAAPFATLVSTYILAKLLGPEDYGNFFYVLSFLNFTVQILNFGAFSTVRYLAGNTSIDSDATAVFKGSLVLFCLMSALITPAAMVGTLLLAKFDNEIPIDLLFYGAIFLCIHVATSLYDNFLQGTGKISSLSKLRFYPKIIAAILFLTVLWIKPDAFLAIGLYHAAIFVALFLVFEYRLVKDIGGYGFSILPIFKDIRTFGLNIYIGSILILGGMQLAPLVIANVTTDNSAVGYYGIAITLTSPLIMVPQIVSTVFFKKFIDTGIIPISLFLSTITLTLLIFMILFLSGEFIILSVFGVTFRDVVAPFKILLIFNFFNGLSQFFDRYFHATGRSVIVRNSSILSGVVLLIGFYWLSPIYALTAVCWSLTASGITNFVYKLISYVCVRPVPQKGVES